MSVRYNGKTIIGTPITDTTPTSGNTTHTVTSDGIYTALSTKAPLASPALTGTPTAPTAESGTNSTQIATTAFVKTANDNLKATTVNPNLLRNWYFVGGGTGRGVFPVNSRGKSSYATNGYTIDGWSFSAGGYVQTLLSSGLQLTGNRHQYYLFNQRISDAIAGKTVTIAIWSSYGLDKRTLVVADGSGYSIGDYFSIDISINTTSHYIYVGFKSTEPTETSLNIVFYAVKLELGTEQTLCHQENGVWVLNEIPDYEEELIRCMTSTADPTDIYANKSLATEQDLASIHATGSKNTTGAPIQPSTYFYLDGVLVLAKNYIGINADFTPDNHKIPSNGALNEPIAKVVTRTGEVTSVPANATATVFVSTNGKEEDGTTAYNYAGTLAFAPGNTGLSIDALTFTASGINVIVRNWMNSARNCAPELKILMLKYNLLN